MLHLVEYALNRSSGCLCAISIQHPMFHGDIAIRRMIPGLGYRAACQLIRLFPTRGSWNTFVEEGVSRSMRGACVRACVRACVQAGGSSDCLLLWDRHRVRMSEIVPKLGCRTQYRCKKLSYVYFVYICTVYSCNLHPIGDSDIVLVG